MKYSFEKPNKTHEGCATVASRPIEAHQTRHYSRHIHLDRELTGKKPKGESGLKREVRSHKKAGN